MFKKLQKDSVALEAWNRNFKKEVFQRLREDRETLCSGYAYLLQHMAQLAGLYCTVINGYGQGDYNRLKDMEVPNHAWNAVSLNGKWYLCDATWSAGIIDAKTYDFHFQYEDSYFLMDPEVFMETHRPLEPVWYLIKAVEWVLLIIFYCYFLLDPRGIDYWLFLFFIGPRDRNRAVAGFDSVESAISRGSFFYVDFFLYFFALPKKVPKNSRSY